MLPGHPDKLCDALADRIVGEIARVDPITRCGFERDDGSFTVQSVSVSLHHTEDADWLALHRHAQQALRDALGPGPLPDLVVNAAGMFICGGPTGDNGTTGKKLVMDAYGPGVPIGGGAWSGKDFHKPDRVGGLLARRLALQCVQAGIGRRVRVQLEYRPNSTQPESISVWADGRPASLPAAAATVPTRDAARAMLAWLRRAHFAPLLDGELARWGHIGAPRTWWEPTDALQQAPSAVATAARTRPQARAAGTVSRLPQRSQVAIGPARPAVAHAA